ncbi:SAV_915 family protein [Streptomyces sp. FXJ1.172]|uniref:SAV_915 family protein n=1 Tax=Streptomyces sp. FXJ1.172 TaxID=710705 RepID=UPI0023DD510F|nr:SAV_915 family protein [Streptomyces sp. FXJ1.172]WEO96230.1 hypothetical protein A6P39_020555 [Streptomyces sp. FXJ1.172]
MTTVHEPTATTAELSVWPASTTESPHGDLSVGGFTSLLRLTATLGPGRPWIRLAEPALRALTAPLGVTSLTVDPQFTAPAPAPLTPAGAEIPALRSA